MFLFDFSLDIRLLAAFAAICIDGVVGDSYWRHRFLRHPVVLFGFLIGLVESWGNRRCFSGLFRRIFGVLGLVVLLILVIGVGVLLGFLSRPSFYVIDIVLVSILLAGRSLDDHVRAVARGLLTGDIAQARHAVSMIVGRNPDNLDAAGIARASIETTAENFSDGFIAPLLFYLWFGLPGILAYKLVNTADSMVGYKSRRYFAYGWAAARLDDVLNIIPARLTGLLIALSRPLSFFKTAAIMLRDARHHRSPNAGWPESAMAAQLGLALGLPRYYGARLSRHKPLNAQGRAAATGDDIIAGLRIMWRSIALVLVFLAAAYLAL